MNDTAWGVWYTRSEKSLAGRGSGWVCDLDSGEPILWTYVEARAWADDANNHVSDSAGVFYAAKKFNGEV